MVAKVHRGVKVLAAVCGGGDGGGGGEVVGGGRVLVTRVSFKITENNHCKLVWHVGVFLRWNALRVGGRVKM